jgi:hypothetical protein
MTQWPPTRGISLPEPTEETQAALDAAISLEQTMRVARELEASWLLNGWSDAQQSAAYAHRAWENSCARLGYAGVRK